jgi:serpin B
MFSKIFGTQRADSRSVTDGNTAFAFDLYSQLKSTRGNLFFSPYSISTCLAMTWAGARGETERQMREVLHLGDDKQLVQESFQELQSQLLEISNHAGTELNIANSLWAQEGHLFRRQFLKIAKTNYAAHLKEVDFVRGSQSVANEINRWVAEATKERIQNIMPPESLSALTRLVLANAIYFKGAWQNPFEKSDTTEQPFYVLGNRERDVPMMHRFDTVRYMAESEFQAIELPYRGGQVSMVILLPREIDGCSQLEARLTPAFISASLGQMKRKDVEIFLPRFKLESGFSLNDTLARMGMPDAFSPKADFSGIDGDRWLFISGIFHKAWGEVNEEGTEAAAATCVAVAGCIVEPPPPPPVFRADHPFVFFIRDTRSGSILFLGRFAEPE